MNVYAERDKLLARLGSLTLEMERVRALLVGLDAVITLIPKQSPQPTPLPIEQVDGPE